MLPTADELEMLKDEEGALGRLLAIVDEFGRLVEDPPVAGGCAMLNTAVEADDAHPALKERAAGAAAGAEGSSGPPPGAPDSKSVTLTR